MLTIMAFGRKNGLKKSKNLLIFWNGWQLFLPDEAVRRLVLFVTNRGEQMVRYYGFYSNVSWGKRKKENSDDIIPNIIEGGKLSPARRKPWARLISKIYEVDPLCCSKCRGAMKLIAFIEQSEVIKKILQHVGLWDADK